MKIYMKYAATLLGLLFMGTASAFDLSIRSFYAGVGAGYATSDAVCDYSTTERNRATPGVNQNRLSDDVFDNRLGELGGSPLEELALIIDFTNSGGLNRGNIVDFNTTPRSLSRNCDDSDVSWKVFGGMKFGEYFGVEAGYADFGETSATVSSSEFLLQQILIDTDLDGDIDGNYRAGNPAADHVPINGSISVEGKQDTVFFGGLLRYNIFDNLEIFLKGGAHYWEVEMNAFGTLTVGDETVRPPYTAASGGAVGGGPTPTGTITIPAGEQAASGNISTLRVDDDGVDPFFGIGLGYTMDNGLGFRAEWERYYFDIDLPQTDAVDPNRYNRELEDEVDVFTLSVLYHFSL